MKREVREDVKRDFSLQQNPPQAISDFKSENITATMIQLAPAFQGAQTALVALFQFLSTTCLSVILSFSRLLSDLILFLSE